jgi:hypothetical protein
MSPPVIELAVGEEGDVAGLIGPILVGLFLATDP